MTGKPIPFASLKRSCGAAIDLLAAHLENDRLEIHAAALEEVCDRIARFGGAGLIVSDLEALAAEFRAVAAAEARGRARDEWMQARGVQEGGK